MKFVEHDLGGGTAVEVLSEEVIINFEQDALDLTATNGYLYDSRKIIMYKENLCDEFFVLSSGIAGSVMQKFSNYRVQAAIIGDFSFTSKSLKAFIKECNRTRQVTFTTDLNAAIKEIS
ncbi:MAG: DUF4180 domain-containing protein [Candidatus Kariarchaeaceae archaeon]